MKHLALALRTLAAWLVTLLIVFPLIWLVLCAPACDPAVARRPVRSASGGISRRSRRAGRRP